MANTLDTVQSVKPADVRVLIDVSGSMKKNDPNNLRQSAFELIVKLLPDTAKAGIWIFSDKVMPVTSWGNVTNAWRSAALLRGSRISSDGLFTDIPYALGEVVKKVSGKPIEVDRHIILLTDGMIDVTGGEQKNNQKAKYLFDELLPQIKANGIKVHTIALSPYADKALLEKIAIATAGLSVVADSADVLTKTFAQVLNTVSPAQQISLKNGQFTVDSHVKEFTLLVFRENAAGQTILRSPDSQQYTSATPVPFVHWHRGQDFDLVTVKKPLQGRWSLDSPIQQGSQVTVLSNINLQLNRLPSSYFVGEAQVLRAHLYENNKKIEQADFLKMISMQMTVTRRDNNQYWSTDLEFNSDNSAESNTVDTAFSASLQMLDKPGLYDVVVKADGKTFEREVRQTIAVYDAFDVEINVGEAVPPVHQVSLLSRHPDTDLEQTHVTAKIIQPDGSEVIKAITHHDQGVWKVALSHPLSGEFRITFQIDTKDKQGVSRVFNTQPRTIIHLIPGEVTTVKADVKPADVKPLPVAELNEEKRSFNYQRLLYIAIPVALLLFVVGGYWVYRSRSKVQTLPVSSTVQESPVPDTETIDSSSEQLVDTTESMLFDMPPMDGQDVKPSTESSEPVSIPVEDVAVIEDEVAPDPIATVMSDATINHLSLPDDAIDIDPADDLKKE